MVSIQIICVGKLKESFYLQAVQEYVKRLGPYCRLLVDEIPETRLPSSPSDAEIAAGLKKEADLMAEISRLKSVIINQNEKYKSLENDLERMKSLKNKGFCSLIIDIFLKGLRL